MILLAFLIGTATANGPHPCSKALWIGVEEHRQCIVEEWNKMSNPLGLKRYRRYSRFDPSVMDFPKRPTVRLSPYHRKLWLEAASKPEPTRLRLIRELGLTVGFAGLQLSQKLK